MQLLVYARNHAPAGGGQGKTFVGLAIGECPQVDSVGGDFGGHGTPTSFVEVRLPAHTIDLLTAVPLLVAKAIAREPRANRRPVVLSCSEGVVHLRLEPGFSDARSVCAPLMPLLARCRVYRDTVTTARPEAPSDPRAQPRHAATP